MFLTATGSGAIFAATGNENITSDNMVNLAELLPRKVNIVEMEEYKEISY